MLLKFYKTILDWLQFNKRPTLNILVVVKIWRVPTVIRKVRLVYITPSLTSTWPRFPPLLDLNTFCSICLLLLPSSAADIPLWHCQLFSLPRFFHSPNSIHHHYTCCPGPLFLTPVILGNWLSVSVTQWSQSSDSPLCQQLPFPQQPSLRKLDSPPPYTHTNFCGPSPWIISPQCNYFFVCILNTIAMFHSVYQEKYLKYSCLNLSMDHWNSYILHRLCMEHCAHYCFYVSFHHLITLPGRLNFRIQVACRQFLSRFRITSSLIF